MGKVHKFLNVYEVIEDKKDLSGCEWLLLQDDNMDYYYRINDIEDPVEQEFYKEIYGLLDEPLYMVLYLTDCGPREKGQGGRSYKIVSKEELKKVCVRLSEEYRQYIQELEKYPYMTFSYLREIMETYDIPEDVRLMSDSGWECGATDMRGAFFHKEDKVIVFTQSAQYSDSDYYKENGWKEVSHKWTEKEVYFNCRWRKHKQKIEGGIMKTDEYPRWAISETIEFLQKNYKN